MASRRVRRVELRVVGSFVVCNACGEAGTGMRSYYSPRMVSNDQVVPGWAVFIAGDHRACVAKVESHGYTRHVGFPAWFVQVCGGCSFRACEEGRVAVCLNPARKEAGGAGLVARRSADKLDVVACSGRRA